MSPNTETPSTLTGFISSEGRYLLKDDIHVGTSPLEAKDAPNPQTETHITLASVRFKPLKSEKDKSPGSIENEPNGSFSDSIELLWNSSKRKSKIVQKTNSSLVGKIVGHDNLASLVQGWAEEGKESTLAFYNVGRSFFCCDLRVPQEPLSQIIFTKAYPTCHDVNKLTRSGESLDVVIGLNTGDIVWFDPLSNKYNRINKQGVINPTAVTSIQWVPGSETKILASHADGSMIFYDKEKDDQPFSPSPPPFNSLFHISKPTPKVSTKYNPLAHWLVSNKAVTAFAFSPDFSQLAIVGVDGGLRIVDYQEEILTDLYPSYFGGLTCVAWSPDRKYILTGGQDDLVTIWSYPDQRILARCQGHNAWVTGVAFDNWKTTSISYRFGSVGADARLLLWDFSPRDIPKLKMRTRRGSQSIHSVHSTLANHEKPTTIVHPLKRRNQVIMLKPSMAHMVHSNPLCSLVFRENSIITTCNKGHIKIWERPVSKIL